MRANLIYALAGLVGAAVAYRLFQNWQGSAPDLQSGFVAPWTGSEGDQTASVLDEVTVAITPSTYYPANVPQSVGDANARAFLDMIAWSEGTSGPDGYRTLFGGGTFDSFADHPRVYVPFRNTSSSAAGRYQILARTWDSLQNTLHLPDFSPDSQDRAALELIRQRGALNDVRAGRTAAAISKVSKVWASLPGAGYSQPERQLAALLQVYADAGGSSEVTA